MNPSPLAPPKPLQLHSMGGRGFRRRQVRDTILIILALVFLAILYLASRPRISDKPIANLKKNGFHGVYNLHAANGELLLFNFRAIEPGKIYRSSGFPRNHRGRLAGKAGIHPAALYNRQAFDFLRSRNIRTVITLDGQQDADAVQGYFEKSANQTGYAIDVIHWAVPSALAYSRDKRELHGGLRRAIQLIDYMKNRQGKGAVLIQGEAGKDAVGIAAAAYELWRNTGAAPPDQLWRQVKERYLVSDVLIKRDKEARKFSGPRVICRDKKYTWVCPENLDTLRPDLERIAQVN